MSYECEIDIDGVTYTVMIDETYSEEDENE